MAVKMDVETLQRLWDDYQRDRPVELRNRLMENYLPLVRYNAERIWSRLPDGVELDDLISAGVFGLMDAIDAFDVNRGVKFEPTASRASAGRCSTNSGPWTGCRASSGAKPANSKRPESRSKPPSAVRPTPTRWPPGSASRSRSLNRSSARRRPSASSALTKSGTRRTATKTSARSIS